ncbi:hypothetical protein RCL1_000392 [Eukaryota sp. TZLM3-RCL]
MAFTCVVYYCRGAVRAENNDALIEAITSANSFHLPLVVVFFFPEHLSARRGAFWLEGCREAIEGMKSRGCFPVVYRAADVSPILQFFTLKAAEVFLDSVFLPDELVFDAACLNYYGPRCRIISTATVIPVDRMVNTPLYSAFVPRAQALMDTYLSLPEDPQQGGLLAVRSSSLPHLPSIEQLDPADKTLLPHLVLDPTVVPAQGWVGGTTSARIRLQAFLDELINYPTSLTSADSPNSSRLSPWLAEGHISPAEVVLAAQLYVARLSESERNLVIPGLKAFIESVVFRRELCFNHIFHNQDCYRRFLNLTLNSDLIDVGNAIMLTLPEWSRSTLANHTADLRPLETPAVLVELGKTPDLFWNSIHRLFIASGFLHPPVRVYWARKLLEFFLTPEEAFGMAWKLNNKYSIDAGTLALPALCSAFGLFSTASDVEIPIYGLLPSAEAALKSGEAKRTRRSSVVEGQGLNVKKIITEAELAIEENWATLTVDDSAGIGMRRVSFSEGKKEHGVDYSLGIHFPGEPRTTADTERITSFDLLEQP